MELLIYVIALISLLGLYLFWKREINRKGIHPSIELISTSRLKEELINDPAIQLVDVRTTLEYSRGYIEPADQIDYMGAKFITKFDSYDKEKPIYLYCRSGNRSAKAANVLAQNGFTKIYDLEGGILKWNKSE